MVSSTSMKHRRFCQEPMKGKCCDELAGLNGVLGRRLARKGYGRASSVLGKFLSFNGDQEAFTDWLRARSGANCKQATDCYECIKEWNRSFGS